MVDRSTDLLSTRSEISSSAQPLTHRNISASNVYSEMAIAQTAAVLPTPSSAEQKERFQFAIALSTDA
jgi:hypothetical protein